MTLPEPHNQRLVADRGCLLWTGPKDRKGYGRLYHAGAQHHAYRLAFELAKGPIPHGMVIDHLCRRPACCNPEHLECVTRAENVLRGASFAAINAAKDSCIHGHPFDEANTYRRPSGHRDCRACSLRRQIKSQEKRQIRRKKS